MKILAAILLSVCVQPAATEKKPLLKDGPETKKHFAKPWAWKEPAQSSDK